MGKPKNSVSKTHPWEVRTPFGTVNASSAESAVMLAVRFEDAQVAAQGTEVATFEEAALEPKQLLAVTFSSLVYFRGSRLPEVQSA